MQHGKARVYKPNRGKWISGVWEYGKRVQAAIAEMEDE